MGDDVREGSRAAGYSMMEARHSVMILGEEVGIHLPRALSTAIASLGPLGAALEAAFPWLAILLGVTLIIEHLKKMVEAAEKVEEAARKMGDGFAEANNKVDQEIIKTEIEIRKLAGEPAWDLLAEKLKLQDAEKGIQNVNTLEKRVKELLETAGASSNLNPFNWFDNSGDVASKAKALREQLHGKGQDDQAVILHSALTLQSHILEQMKQQGTASSKELENQEKYVAFLQQEADLIQKQADAAVLADQAQQGKDRAERIKKEEEEQRKAEEAQQRGLDKRIKIEEEYYKKQKEAKKKAQEEAAKDRELDEKGEDILSRMMEEHAREQGHIAEESGKEAAEHTKKMAALRLQAAEEAANGAESLDKKHAQQRLQDLKAAQTAFYDAEKAGLRTEIANLDTNGKDYELHLKQLQDRELELTQAHENKLTALEEKAEKDRAKRILEAHKHFTDEMARGLSQTLMGHESFSKMMVSLGDQVVSGMLENAAKSIMANDMTKASDAAAAARKAFLAGWHFPWPVNIVMAPVLGAMAFASAMAFEEGGVVPGVERGDVVNARLTPGEGVIPKPVMEGLQDRARHGGADQQPIVQHITHRHVHNWHTLDSGDVSAFLDRHGDKLEQHMEHHFSRRNM